GPEYHSLPTKSMTWIVVPNCGAGRPPLMANATLLIESREGMPSSLQWLVSLWGQEPCLARTCFQSLRPTGLRVSAHRHTGQSPDGLAPIFEPNVNAVHRPVVGDLLGPHLRHEHPKLRRAPHPNLGLHLGSWRLQALPADRVQLTEGQRQWQPR